MEATQGNRQQISNKVLNNSQNNNIRNSLKLNNNKLNINISNNLNLFNDNLNNNIGNNINLMNNNLDNRLQINYQIGYINNNINNHYNIKLLNDTMNYQNSTNKNNSDIQNFNFISISPIPIQSKTSGEIKQGIGIQYANNTPNNYNPYGNIQYNLLENNNVNG